MVAVYLILILILLARNLAGLCMLRLMLAGREHPQQVFIWSSDNRNTASVPCLTMKPGELLLYVDEAKSISASFAPTLLGHLRGS